MRTSRAIGLYVSAVVLLGALFAPWLFWGLQALAVHSSFFDGLARQPFHRIFNRALLIVAFLGLWPLLRYAGFRSWADVGYAKSSGWWRHILIGFFLGLGSLLLALVIAVAVGTRTVHLDKSLAQLVGALLRFLLTGIVVALIEETFFRGALQGAFQRWMNVLVAVVLASAIYSALHFLKPSQADVAADQVVWSSGFNCLYGIMTRSFTGPDFFVGFVTLFLAGCILGLAYVRTRALYLPIGLHVGWVVANETARWLGAYQIIQDKAAWLVLAVLFALVAWLCQTKIKPLRGPEPSGSGGGAPLT